MNVTYDPEANSVHINLVENVRVWEDKYCDDSDSLRGDVLLGLSEDGQLLHIRVLNARELLPRPFLDAAKRA